MLKIEHIFIIAYPPAGWLPAKPRLILANEDNSSVFQSSLCIQYTANRISGQGNPDTLG